MRIMLFAGLAEAAGQRVLELDLDRACSVGELLEQLREAHPDLPWKGVRLAVNQTYVADEHVVDPGAEFALIPPVSGG